MDLIRTEGTIGILESENSRGPYPFAEAGFARKLCLAGQRRGLTVFVFCPEGISADGSLITGYTWEGGRWVSRSYPPPDLVYDRYLAQGSRERSVKRRNISLLASRHPIRYLTRGLAGKWKVYLALKECPDVSPFLPKTFRYENPRQLRSMFRLWNGSVFLKPEHGTHGKRTLWIRKGKIASEGIQLVGRDGNNTVIHHGFRLESDALNYAHRFMRGRSFLIQPHLKLLTREGEPYDIRALVQKGASGQWSLTGLAVRQGKSGSITSNLHGGGIARRALPFLQHELGELKGKAVATKIKELSEIIPPYLESRFGRLAELGIDYGVETSGQIWVLEVNSKPGRSAFAHIGETRAARKAVESPLDYAQYLLR